MLNLTTAVLAVISLVVAAVVTWAALASSSPERDALRTLSHNEAVLANEIRAVNSAIDRVNATRSEGIAYAQQFEGPLVGATQATDEVARAAAENARVDFAAALEAMVVPAGIEPPAATAVDEESLASIGSAIDAIAVHSGEVEALSESVADLEAEIAAHRRTFATAMATFAATLPRSAEVIANENPNALDDFREVVIATADAVAASGLRTPESAGTLTAYAAAVEALRDDQARAERAIAEQRAREEEERRRQVTEGESGGTTDPTAPTDPTSPTDPTTPTDPTDPAQPTDPLLPQPPDPGAGGG
ncbi:hypothetical protein [Microbacterium sp. NPDC056736]|uniref:hypothetical protein n=1 Tax=Microbacterium sp. NPDC056736 TaxID=3345932 RepID=UPI00366BC1C3